MLFVGVREMVDRHIEVADVVGLTIRQVDDLAEGVVRRECDKGSEGEHKHSEQLHAERERDPSSEKEHHQARHR